VERAANGQVNDMGSTQASAYNDDHIEFPPREATFPARWVWTVTDPRSHSKSRVSQEVQSSHAVINVPKEDQTLRTSLNEFESHRKWVPYIHEYWEPTIDMGYLKNERKCGNCTRKLGNERLNNSVDD
jgi:hypothetical protein